MKPLSKVIVFGTADLASLAHFYLKTDSPLSVCAFTVHESYLKDSQFEGLPVLPFESIVQEYSPAETLFFAPMTHSHRNQHRERVYLEAKKLGYRCASYISSRATVFENVKIGENCFILENNTIQPFVTIGNNVVLWSGNHIGHHSEIRDSVFFTSHVVLSGNCRVEKYSFFGVNSSVRDGLTIAEGSFIGMGATITRDTKPYAFYAAPESIEREAREL